MHRTLRSTFGLLLAVLSAFSSLVQQQADARLLHTHECTSRDGCPIQPHSFSLRDGNDALAASPGRLGTVLVRLVQRSGWYGDARAGIDVLFFSRNELLLARARASLGEHLDLTLTLHAATQGTASSPSRAPPALT